MVRSQENKNMLTEGGRAFTPSFLPLPSSAKPPEPPTTCVNQFDHFSKDDIENQPVQPSLLQSGHDVSVC